MEKIAKTPEPPYYAVIFTSLRAEGNDDAYARAAERMIELARSQPGYLGYESVRDTNGLGITVSYWADEASISNWKQNTEHLRVQANGRMSWYLRYHTRVCRVERAYGFERGTGSD
ncbi:MAG: antibiotic biosynthesis monooxygenase [Gammaproteobacteria bacterium]|nr:antibiotic biosynthesis monooxygenase [Gammaproteobacteria bacterium]